MFEDKQRCLTLCGLVTAVKQVVARNGHDLITFHFRHALSCKVVTERAQGDHQNALRQRPLWSGDRSDARRREPVLRSRERKDQS